MIIFVIFVLILCLSIEVLISKLNSSSFKLEYCYKVILMLNSFEKGGDGGGLLECDNKFYFDKMFVVVLLIVLFNYKKSCLKEIIMFGNGKSVNVKVVDECDLSKGCKNNIVDGFVVVWKVLGVFKKKSGEMDIFWLDV